MEIVKGLEPNDQVVVSFRGGKDGLSAVVPYGDPSYAGLRPNIGIPSAELFRGAPAPAVI